MKRLNLKSLAIAFAVILFLIPITAEVFVVGGGPAVIYILDASSADQGATGNGKTIKAYVDVIGTSKKATIKAEHSSTGNTTPHTLTTPVTIPSNITFIRERGAILDGAGTLIINGLIGNYDRGQYFGSSLTVELSATSLQRFVYPESWGIDGTADEVQINKALECIHTADTGYGGSASAILQAGKRYNIAGPILMKHSYSNLVSSLPSRNAVIHRTMTTGNSLTIEPDTPASNQAQHITVRGLSFYQTAAVPTAGAHIHMQSASYVHIEKCLLIDGYYGIYMLGGVDCKITDSEIRGTALTTGKALATGLHLGKGVNTDVDDIAALSIRGLRIEHDTGQDSYQIGMHIAGADGVWVYDTHIGTHGADGDLYISPGVGNHLAGVYFIGCYFDGQGVKIATASTTTYGLIQFKDCFFDGDGSVAGSISGLEIEIACDAQDIQIHGCQFFNWDSHGIYVASTAVKGVSIIGNNIWNCDKGGGGAAGIGVIDGASEFSIQNNFIGNSTGGGQANSIVCGQGGSVSQCIISGNNCQNNTDDLIYVYGATGVQVKNNIDGSELATIASATTTTLPSNGENFRISGTANITSITSSWRGRSVKLRFIDVLTFTDGSNLKIAGNFVTTADDTITINCDGTNWYEDSRSIN